MATRYTIAQLDSQASTTLPDNLTQEISAADVRNMFANFLATMKPSFASMRRSTSLVLALTPVASVITPWETITTQDLPEMAPVLIGGTITHQITTLGNTAATDRITFYTGVSGTGGAELTFTLYENGVATDVIARVSTTGAANVVNAILSGLRTHTADVVYTIRVASSNNANYTFTNGTFRVENVPVAA